MNKRITSWGWAFYDSKGNQIGAQVGHTWDHDITPNGELTIQQKRLLRKLQNNRKN